MTYEYVGNPAFFFFFLSFLSLDKNDKKEYNDDKKANTE